MAIDFKNIIFKYIKVTGGSATIDTLMTDKIFDTTKPQGVYKCFVFPNANFAGLDYSDLQNLVSIESINMWTNSNRDTFLGFNEESNEFIINLGGWLSLKDSDLKTDGELSHSGQAGLFVTTISETKDAKSKFELNQTDGSKAYLNIKPINLVVKDKSISIIYPPACVEKEKKSIKNATLFVKDETLWAKSPTDNTVIMVNNCVRDLPSRTPITLSNDNKTYGRYTSCRYGKQIVYFDSTASDSVGKFSSCGFEDGRKVCDNQTGVLSIEYNETDSLDDILNSGELVEFKIRPKNRYVWGHKIFNDQSSSNPKVYPNILSLEYGSFPVADSSLVDSSIKIGKLSKFFDERILGFPFELVSWDTRKPFIFQEDPLKENVRYIDSLGKVVIEAFPMFNTLPTGYIALAIIGVARSGHIYICKWETGSPVDVRDLSNTRANYLKVSGINSFVGKSIYNDLVIETVSKDDIVNGVGFSPMSFMDQQARILNEIIYMIKK